MWETPEPDGGSLDGHWQETGSQPEESNDSLLWAHGRTTVLPGGNYPVLEALTLGYLLREPMDADRWLSVLDQHLLRREDRAVWDALADKLRFLEKAERKRCRRIS